MQTRLMVNTMEVDHSPRLCVKTADNWNSSYCVSAHVSYKESLLRTVTTFKSFAKRQSLGVPGLGNEVASGIFVCALKGKKAFIE